MRRIPFCSRLSGRSATSNWARMMLRALEGLDCTGWGPDSVDYCHALVEIGRQAYADRDCFIGDPRTGDVPVAKLLSETHADALRSRVSARQRNAELMPVAVPAHRDTVFVAVVDRDRNAVAFINSIFDDFGCGIVSPTTGVIFHNRASGFVLERGHPNAIAGRKRPLHTIIPAMLVGAASASGVAHAEVARRRTTASAAPTRRLIGTCTAPR